VAEKSAWGEHPENTKMNENRILSNEHYSPERKELKHIVITRKGRTPEGGGTHHWKGKKG
jgi:hypothetical protein